LAVGFRRCRVGFRQSFIEDLFDEFDVRFLEMLFLVCEQFQHDENQEIFVNLFVTWQIDKVLELLFLKVEQME
jgi:hypothetical protein